MISTTSTTIKEYLKSLPDVPEYMELGKAEQAEFCKRMLAIITDKHYQAVVNTLIEFYKEALIANHLDKGEFSSEDFRNRINALRDLNSKLLSFAANVKKT